jgi:hypothetical protein
MTPYTGVLAPEPKWFVLVVRKVSARYRGIARQQAAKVICTFAYWMASIELGLFYGQHL